MTPLLLLDDVMSELDPGRRERLVRRLDDGGQALITAADEESLPAPALASVVRMPPPARARGGRGMSRRRAPRQASAAIRAARERAAPRTGLAAVQAAWAGAVGEQLAAVAEPVSERAGTLTIECADTVWAQELDLMQGQLLERLRARVGGAGPRSAAVPREQRPLLVSVYPRFAGNLSRPPGSSAVPNWYSYGNSH